jgi:hypothetical protein
MLPFKHADQLAGNLKQKLQLLAIDKLAKQAGFVKRTPKKIKPLNFLLAFFITILTGGNSLATLAATIGLIAKCRLSKQAIDKRIKQPFIQFLEAVLEKTLSFNLVLESKKSLGAIFNRIITNDSTTVLLDAKLAEHFPGNNNQSNKKTAILKIQAFYDLLAERFCHLSFAPYTKNDQKASVDILGIIQRGDLIIRDLGYFVLSVFTQIQQLNAYFLSRLKYNVTIYELDGETKIDLLKLLKKYGKLDIDVIIGAEEKLLARLVALPVSTEVAAERRRKAKRDCRNNPSKHHLALLGWNIFITNVQRDQLDVEQLVKLYGCRWRIEIIFKSWKSHFNLENVPTASLVRVLSYIYAMLIFITIFQTYIYITLYNKMQDSTNNQLSLFKLSKFIKNQFWAIILFMNNFEIIEEQILYHCRYEKRTDRLNYEQQITFLS